MHTQAPVGTDLDLAHVELHVEDLDAWRDVFTDRYGLRPAGVAGSAEQGFRSVALIGGRAVVVLTEALTDDHPCTAYVLSHGPGVADIAMRTADVDAVFASAVAAGAPAVAEPHDGPDGVRTATIRAFGDVTHTFLYGEPTTDAVLPPGFSPISGAPGAAAPEPDNAPGLHTMDHFAVCVPNRSLDQTIDFYTTALGFQQTFEERIIVGSQAMDSKVVQSRSGSVTFTILEPDVNCAPGQIDQFIKDHGGAGVQHIAFATDDIVHAVESMRHLGVEFLKTPGTYYDLLPNRFVPAGHPIAELRAAGILVDEDHGGELFQLFTRSTHPRRTLFFEVIERAGARLFGSNNIKALYEAVELEQSGS
ncbi:4-hydroxyphenylpyruvate dioxygenase [Catenulispora pinisilvae]|uniref:4-hydroxyphenylpyruvate dioxygenase n=1 Tax=Catenulispora pinisilvae TaxID=2705253 RepID=UPI0018912C52|nr:4-hydroxyphenylpyruvate dioxygenase [Catenulispora pinisilvae]